MGDWIVGHVNCTATPDNLACTLDDVGEGTGSIFDGIAIPLMTLFILLAIAGGVGGIFGGVVKRLME